LVNDRNESVAAEVADACGLPSADAMHERDLRPTLHFHRKWRGRRRLPPETKAQGSSLGVSDPPSGPRGRP